LILQVADIPTALTLDPKKPIIKESGVEPKRSYEKMSKSKYNGVDPSQCIAKHGADCTRAHILFSAPVSEVLEWNEEAIVGIERWLGRVWRVVLAAADKKNREANVKAKPATSDLRNVSKMSDTEKPIWRKVQQTVASVTDALSESYALNTMISDLIKLTNTLDDIDVENSSIRADFQVMCAETLVKLIAPTTPGVAEECWKVVLNTKAIDSSWASVFDIAWPEVEDRSIFEINDVKCAVQVDGRTRFVLDVPGAIVENKDEVVKLVRRTEEWKNWIVSKMQTDKPKDIIVAPGGRVVNFVFKEKTARKTRASR
jgi:leucyl-tRNA synthetase